MRREEQDRERDIETVVCVFAASVCVCVFLCASNRGEDKNERLLVVKR